MNRLAKEVKFRQDLGFWVGGDRRWVVNSDRAGVKCFVYAIGLGYTSAACKLWKARRKSMLSPRVQSQDTQTHNLLVLIRAHVDTVLTAVAVISVPSLWVVVMPDTFYLPSHLVLTTAQRIRDWLLSLFLKK